MGHLFRDLPRLHCFTFHDFISYTHSSLFYQDWELLPVSSLPGSRVSRIASLLPLLQEKRLGRKPQLLHGLLVFGLLLWHLEKILCCTGTEYKSEQDRQMFSFFNFYDSINYSWYEVLIKSDNSAFDFRETLFISKSIVQKISESAKSHCYYKVFEVTVSHHDINKLFLC